MRIKAIGEDRLVERIAALAASKKGARRLGRVVVGIGDDASVSRQKAGRLLLATTDVLVEGVHFRRRWTDPGLLGRKSVNISLSDVAAMGGSPLFVLVSITLPPSTSSSFVDKLYGGIVAASSESGAALAGGNTARSDRLTVTTTVVGETPGGKAALRSGAKVGDAVFVTGTLGDSALGLAELEKRGLKRALSGRLGRAALKHLDPRPRVELGRALASAGLVGSMMDVSDGLLLDLARLCKASGKGARIEAAKLPMSAEVESVGAPRAAQLALCGGEDYELLFTAPPGRRARITALGKRLGVGITEVGRIVGPKDKVAAFGEDGRRISLKSCGYRHF